jgi:hypothetical protein
MADQLNVAALSLNESQHAPQPGGGFERSTYIPPHMRSSGRADPGPGPVPGPTPNGTAAPGATQLNGNAPGFNRNGYVYLQTSYQTRSNSSIVTVPALNKVVATGALLHQVVPAVEVATGMLNLSTVTEDQEISVPITMVAQELVVQGPEVVVVVDRAKAPAMAVG